MCLSEGRERLIQNSFIEPQFMFLTTFLANGSSARKPVNKLKGALLRLLQALCVTEKMQFLVSVAFGQ